MVKDRLTAKADPASAKFEGDRLTLPEDLVQSAGNAAGLVGTNKINCWLLVLSPGRYRLVTTEAVSRILSRIEEVGAPGDVLDYSASNSEAAVRARLIACTVSPPGPGWRLTFPKAARQLVPKTEERSYVFLLIVAGFIEVWFPDTLRRSLPEPLSEALSE